MSEEQTKWEKTEIEDLWRHRSREMRCRTCMYFVEKKGIYATDKSHVAAPPMKVGRCRRHAPTMKGFPVVFEYDYCGDHKLDETKL